MKKILFSTMLLATAMSMSAFDADNLYVVGSGCASGWSPSDALEMTKVEDNVFTWSGELKASGEFKFLIARDWHPSITCNFETENQQNETVENDGIYQLYVRPNDQTGQDNKFQVAVSGNYTLNVDLNEMIMAASLNEIIEEPLELYIVGNATAAGWDTNNAMNQKLSLMDDGTYAWKGQMTEGNFRFLLSNKWWPSYSVDCAEDDLYDQDVTVGEYNIKLWENEPDPNVSFKMTEAGLYNINLDLENMKMVITEAAPELYIIGNALNGGSSLWDLGWAQACTPTDVNPNVFEWNGYLYKLGYSNENPDQKSTAQFRFLKQGNDWNPGYFAEYVDDEIYTGGTFNISENGEGDMKFTVEADGWYKLIIDTENLTLSVFEGSDDSEGPEEPEDPEDTAVDSIWMNEAAVSLDGNTFTVANGIANVYDINGRVIAAGESVVKLPVKGVYVAVVNGKALKFVVR